MRSAEESMTASDFCNVRLSAAGIKFAGEGAQLRVTVNRISYVFVGEASTRVLTSEWARLLSQEKTYEGEPLLELAPETVEPVEEPATEAKQTKGGK
jgi:hypothetical protein